jgi:hypothetical protein
MRYVVLQSAHDVVNVTLANPKRRRTLPDGSEAVIFVSNVHVFEKSVPCVRMRSSKVHRYAVSEGSKEMSMVLVDADPTDVAVVRALIMEILACISQRRGDWFPKSTAPRNMAAIQRCFEDPLSENGDGVHSRMCVRSGVYVGKKTPVHVPGRLHDVRLLLTGIRFMQSSMQVEWKVLAIEPLATKTTVPMFLQRPAVRAEKTWLPDEEDVDAVRQVYEDKLGEFTHHTDDVIRSLEEIIRDPGESMRTRGMHACVSLDDLVTAATASAIARLEAILTRWRQH